MGTSKELKPEIHICPICGKISKIFASGQINQDCPCLNCQLIQLGYRKNDKSPCNKNMES